MTGFHEVRFPDDISWGATGGPRYSTTVVMSDSGHEQRNINWAEARMKWNVSHGVKTDDQVKALIDFFRARKGKAYGFRFKDWSDYVATNQAIAKISGTDNTYQLRKQYSDVGRTEVRFITKPVQGTLSLRNGGTLLTPTTDYTVDWATGIITLTADTGPSSLTATFEFDVPVRFDTDEMDLSLDFYNAANWNNITVVELRQ